MTTKSEKKSDPKFSRMDESELYDIKEFFKHLFFRNYEDKNKRELVYVVKIEEEVMNPIIEKEGLIPLIQDEKKKVTNTLKMSVIGNKKIRATLSNFHAPNEDKEGEGIQGDIDLDDTE